MFDEKKLLAKAQKPFEESLKLHERYKGKIEVSLKCRVKDFNDFAYWYTPGVSAACLAIKENPEKVYEYTNKWNTVAVISDGSRVLGLGDIGPEAAIPVMEGKALLFKYLGGVDVFPICLDTKDPEEIIRTVKILQPSLGGVNLEDIASPKCFEILNRLRNECSIPVWHDDQQGTAAVTLAGLINALKIVDKGINEVKVAMVGAGAANIRIANLIIEAGVEPENIIMCDINGTLHRGRTELQKDNPEKWDICTRTNKNNLKGDISQAMEGADVLIALSASGPGIIKKEWVSSMAKDAIVFVCANPVPEIWPWEAKEAGARVVATGRSDFPNQINNSIGFPGIFRGALDVRASAITDQMCIAASYELAKYAQEKGLTEECLVPTMDDAGVFIKEAAAVGMKAIEQGIAKIKLTEAELLKKAEDIITRSKKQTKLMMDNGIIES
jgi:malate dehydrogenase (oxaloacetate-decarboxylating)